MVVNSNKKKNAAADNTTTMMAHTAQCLQPARPDGRHLHPSFTTSSSSTPSAPKTTMDPLLSARPSPVPFVRLPTPQRRSSPTVSQPPLPMTFRMREQRRKQCFLGRVVVIIIVLGRPFKKNIYIMIAVCCF